MENNGNLLICGATMVLPNATKIGDLRISDGIIAEIAEPGALESLDNEKFVDGTGLHLLLVVLTRKFILETLGNLIKKT